MAPALPSWKLLQLSRYAFSGNEITCSSLLKSTTLTSFNVSNMLVAQCTWPQCWYKKGRPLPPSFGIRYCHPCFPCVSVHHCLMGMKSGEIPDSSITASEEYSASYSPKHARIDTVSNDGAWCPRQCMFKILERHHVDIFIDICSNFRTLDTSWSRFTAPDRCNHYSGSSKARCIQLLAIISM